MVLTVTSDSRPLQRPRPFGQPSNPPARPCAHRTLPQTWRSSYCPLPSMAGRVSRFPIKHHKKQARKGDLPLQPWCAPATFSPQASLASTSPSPQPAVRWWQQGQRWAYSPADTVPATWLGSRNKRALGKHTVGKHQSTAGRRMRVVVGSRLAEPAEAELER